MVLVLDAMGVIYSVGDDVRYLLCPFIAEKGGTEDVPRIEQLYRAASLGSISAAEFWRSIGVSPTLDDEYLRRHQLSPGLIDFLETVRARGLEVWCLSNDLSSWSRKLRRRFGLDQYINGYVISADVGCRKPDPAIFHKLLARLGATPGNVLLVDDQPRNLDAAAGLGFTTVLFAPDGSGIDRGDHQIVATFGELLLLVN